MRTVLAGALALALTMAVEAAPQGSRALPEGWKGRFDAPDAEASDLKESHVTTEGTSLTFNTGPMAGIYYKPEMTASGAYELSATFSQLMAAEDAEAYGLFIGGIDLEKTSQRYTYFLFRQDGKYSIGSRTGDKTSAIVDWKSPKGPKGIATSHTLTVRSDSKGLHFLISGSEVRRIARGKAESDGNTGLRVNHHLSVQVDRLGLKAIPAQGRR